MFNEILLLIKKDLRVEAQIIGQIRRAASDARVRIVGFDELHKKDLENVALIITLGGDGTFVKAANIVEDIPVLGINAEPETSEGALTSLSINELDKLESMLKGNHTRIVRQRAQVRLNGKLLEEHAVNEVYVGSTMQYHSSRYVLTFKDCKEEHRSSGVIITTGTGSPAWYYSAGGTIFDHDEEALRFIVREPYHGKRIFTPKLLEGTLKKGERLRLESKRDFGGIVAINDVTYDFNGGDVVEIELSPKPVEVLVP